MPSTKSSSENSGTSSDEKYSGFTAEERAAMKEHAQEQKKAAARRGSTRAEKAAAAERDVLAKIAEMPEADRVLAERIHRIIKAAAPELAPKLWYGMPAYARDGKVVCHFQSAEKFKTRYATLGFSDQAALDDGTMWPTAYAVKELTAADEQFITALVTKAVS
ncbi:iron chaperone [Streptomyces ossamyceticus]|uniref:iron chaperone n=1 Tax=Streptomyces ossamyceticus TaxID=249581 RepID=UPI0036E2F5CB